MNKVAIFEKVSKLTFLKSISDESAYNFSFPCRATIGSAGYDLITPIDIKLNPKESVVVPTGLKCKIEEGWVLMIFPKSGLGFKYNMKLANTVGIVDSDYYDNETNEGHILVKVVNEGNEVINISKGSKFCQALFLPFGITFDDNVGGIRSGGFGSTGK